MSVTSGATDIYDPVTNGWSPGAPLVRPRYRHTAGLLANGSVLVAGGLVGGVETATTERYTGFASVGAACLSAADCQSGFCVDGVCCNSACNAGPCDACSVAAGASTNGTCALLTGPACNDGNACSEVDTCQAGVCVGKNAVVCPPPLSTQADTR